MLARCVACVLAACVALLGLRPGASAAPKVERVIVVFKTHFDLGYTKLAREVLEQYRTTMIDKALDVCDAARQLPPRQRFVWTLPSWLKTRSAQPCDLRGALLGKPVPVKEGRFELPLPAMAPASVVVGKESMRKDRG